VTFFRVGQLPVWITPGATIGRSTTSRDLVVAKDGQFFHLPPGTVIPGSVDSRIVLEPKDLQNLTDSQMSIFREHIDNAKAATVKQLTEVAFFKQQGWFKKDMPLELSGAIYQDCRGNHEQPRGHQALGHLWMGNCDFSTLALLKSVPCIRNTVIDTAAATDRVTYVMNLARLPLESPRGRGILATYFERVRGAQREGGELNLDLIESAAEGLCFQCGETLASAASTADDGIHWQRSLRETQGIASDLFQTGPPPSEITVKQHGSRLEDTASEHSSELSSAAATATN
jgi:hypothetical protein